MQQHEKACKGINKAHGFQGCGKMSFYRLHGLCPSCQWDWMQNDERGKIYYAKVFSSKVKKATEKRNRLDTKEKKVKLLSNDEYRAKHVQPILNAIAREIDFGQPCIASDTFGKMAGGHYYSVGSNRTTALNLHNIHIQSFHSNSWKGGDEIRYRQGIVKIYGNEYIDFMEALKQTPALHLGKTDLMEIRLKAKNALKHIERIKRRPEDRIALRNEINQVLGIYPDKFSQFYGTII